MDNSLKSTVLSGVAWNTIARIGQQIVQFVTSIVLARLLLPDAFGVVAMLQVFTSFLGLLADAGLGAAVLQTKNLQERHVYTIFWLSLIIGIILAGVLFFSAPLLAAFYNTPVLDPLTRFWSLNFVIGAMSSVPAMYMQRQFRFNSLARIDLFTTFASGFIGVGLAFLGAGLWALATEALVATILTTVLRLYFSRLPLRFLFDWSAFLEVRRFTMNLLGFNFVNYFARNADTLIVGRVFGSAVLGNYNLAYTLMLLPITQVISVVANVMTATLSHIQDDKVRAKRIYLRAMGLLSLLAFPMMLGLLVTAEPFVLTIFGDRWSGMINVLRILALVGLLQSLLNPTGWIVISQGRTDVLFRWGFFNAVVFVASFFIGVLLGSVEALALAYAVANVLVFYPYISAVGRLINMSFFDLISSVWKALVASIVMTLIVYSVDATFLLGQSPLIRLSITVPLGVVSYFLLMIVVLRAESVHELFDIISDRLPKRKPLVAE